MGSTARLIGLAPMHLNDTVMLIRSWLGNVGNGLIPALHLHALFRLSPPLLYVSLPLECIWTTKYTALVGLGWLQRRTARFSIKSNFCLKDIPTSPGLCFDEEKVSYSFGAVTRIELLTSIQIETSSTTKIWSKRRSRLNFPVHPRVGEWFSIQKNL